jgi:outer membrane protein TolC
MAFRQIFMNHKLIKRKKSRMKNKCFIVLLFGCFINYSVFSQTKDSLKTLTSEAFFEIIIQYHPVVKQANLIPEAARQQLVVARGGFDPYFFSSLNQKQFKGEEYYLLNESGLKVPTWLGIELKGSYTINNGININPENTIPVGGQAMFGISAPIGQGLFLDQRRATLKQAKIFREASEFKRISMLNDLLFTATKDYWEWTFHYNNYNIFKEALIVAEERFKGVKGSFNFGDIPAIDTLEAFINLQNLQFNLNESLMNFRNASFMLSNHLWYSNDMPLEISENLVPPLLNDADFSKTLTLDSVDNIINAIAVSHPDIRQIQYKLQQLDIDRRLKIEYLKPKVNFNYNILSEKQFAFNNNPEFVNIFNNNYKWGFEVAFPLFWGEGRGNFKLAKIKIQDAEYKLQLKNVEVINKIQTYFNELIILKNQVTLYQQATNNYQKLLDAENIKFQSGESSMFLINARQMKLLEFQSKLIEVKTKYFKSLAGVAWASGTLYNN